MRVTASQPPLINPKCAIASNPYCEHEGTNLQLGGKRGEINR